MISRSGRGLLDDDFAHSVRGNTRGAKASCARAVMPPMRAHAAHAAPTGPLAHILDVGVQRPFEAVDGTPFLYSIHVTYGRFTRSARMRLLRPRLLPLSAGARRRPRARRRRPLLRLRGGVLGGGASASSSAIGATRRARRRPRRRRRRGPPPARRRPPPPPAAWRRPPRPPPAAAAAAPRGRRAWWSAWPATRRSRASAAGRAPCAGGRDSGAWRCQLSAFITTPTASSSPEHHAYRSTELPAPSQTCADARASRARASPRGSGGAAGSGTSRGAATGGSRTSSAGAATRHSR